MEPPLHYPFDFNMFCMVYPCIILSLISVSTHFTPHDFVSVCSWLAESLLRAFISFSCWAFIRKGNRFQNVFFRLYPKAEAYKDTSQLIRTSTACVPERWMEQTGRDWLLIIVTDVGSVGSEDEIIGGQMLKSAFKNWYLTHTTHTFKSSLTPTELNTETIRIQWPHDSNTVVVRPYSHLFWARKVQIGGWWLCIHSVHIDYTHIFSFPLRKLGTFCEF